MENHARFMVICLPTDQRDVCHCISIGKRTTPIGENTRFYINSCSNHGDIFTKDPQAFLELDLQINCNEKLKLQLDDKIPFIFALWRIT
jgi:hypothetical protein